VVYSVGETYDDCTGIFIKKEKKSM